ncbi:MAG: ATP-dependent DNA helicase [Candidatus Wolfebacteria bacterium GW2011_GWC2_46_275]|uniref:ATP-dependent DNA helicase RecG n=2 Tax=Candidatus Wolfeibacteriota TaxID=1752735 RepID=A0A0G1X5T3_9BACT|nr:MAG: ATP-dependent DNA helicase, ATP-dependent DNA helicase RecG [Candidatus Wolfebacteria bacterium GW2011_GWB1_47_1]KKU36949.1 MAG: ATP-dependent DNA helicase [Candidatus Wolfebacteria bacterium GW2011_GWC2_46_275]KKU42205.1 MAG: ATP-dependent DNA helicase [Candidatus Wolfebacteria bacterium GW2011_GWB2_46_69]KKU53828.1 MAG: ATP-dependent DNA helicase [Candidatus Wolfebacteria bacterium GW2011_GWC1_47_103]KKU59444.1 MAG: ATP-dependent DNA helicase [Candidatus Wolfebacteria bacterium GW2011
MSQGVRLETELRYVKGIGLAFATRLEKLGLKTVKDLLWHFPSRYEDFSKITNIADLIPGEPATIQGVIHDIKILRSFRKKMFIIQATVVDNTGSIRATWFNQKFLVAMLKKGMVINLAGKISDGKNGLSFSHPSYEIVGFSEDEEQFMEDAAEYREEIESFKHTGRLVPVYPETRGVTSKGLRFLIKPLLDEMERLPETLPEGMLVRAGVAEINDALRKIHFPDTMDDVLYARRRFAFEDIFYLQLVNILERSRLAKENAHACGIDQKWFKELLERLPFELTDGQRKTVDEIVLDLAKPHPMNRLLQGDVGSGKTIVAIMAAIIAAENGLQASFMAPTEILANQHYQTFKKIFGNYEKGVALLTASGAKVFYGEGLESEAKKPEVIKKLAKGEIKIAIGTHALIQKGVEFANLALVVIDEQHRFGVRQRQALAGHKKGDGEYLPHFLSMSATPIPRTLSLTLFGDLDISVIGELPKGRKEIITKIVPPASRTDAYAFIRGQVKKGRQVFVICPRIEKAEEDEDKKNWFAVDTKTVKEEYEKLSKKIFPDMRVAMLHGKLKPAEKDAIMQSMKKGDIDVLVATSVIEVGVDIPNASIMMIEGSDRFGLSQLYQFKGRVGRGEHQSFCLLFTDSSAQTTKDRLEALVGAKNGFELAEKDLQLRGPGEFMGQSQTGLPDLAMRSLHDLKLVKSAREAAEGILGMDPDLTSHPQLKDIVRKFHDKVHLE